MTEPTFEEIESSDILQLSHWMKFGQSINRDKIKTIVRRFYELGGWIKLWELVNTNDNRFYEENI